MADAPCHGQRYHNEDISDNHPDRSDDIPDLLQRICVSMNSYYWFVRVSKHTDKMIQEFNEILESNSTDKRIECIDMLKLEISPNELNELNELEKKKIDMSKLSEGLKMKLKELNKKLNGELVKTIFAETEKNM